MSAALERLKEHQIKPSLQRLAIMDFLLKNRIHPTVDVIFNNLYPSMPTLSKTTVYNTLKLLVDNGAVQMLTIDEKNARYDADISVHAHFKCKACGNVYDMPLLGVKQVELPDGFNFEIEEMQIYYKGYCSSCNTHLTNKKN